MGELSACGRPLHYNSEAARRLTQQMIALSGGKQCLKVTIGDRTWLVQKHYIALHGLKAQDLLRGRVPAKEVIGGGSVVV
jgi:hypothetical protein